jgi:phage terminase large subunit-like protein
MKKVKATKPQTTKFAREYELQVGKFIVAKGDIIKIDGEHGGKFRFESLTTNTENGKVWVDCFEIHKKSVGAFRSFTPDRVKRVPTKRGKKNVD